jgi:Putative transposase
MTVHELNLAVSASDIEHSSKQCQGSIDSRAAELLATIMEPTNNATGRDVIQNAVSFGRHHTTDMDHTRWVHSPDNYFLPNAVLRKVFRGKFVAALRQAFQNGELRFPENFKLLPNPRSSPLGSGHCFDKTVT